MRRSERIFAAVFGVGLLGAVVYPILVGPPIDSFPLSNYPMFADARPTEAVRISHVVAFDARGGGRVVPPSMLGSIEVMQALRTVELSINQGTTGELCTRTAAIVGQAGAQWSDAVRVDVRLDVFNALVYFESSRSPLAGRVFATCAVPREGP